MGPLDKFNDWYNRVVPMDEPFVNWKEPVAGARYRWKKNLVRRFGWLVSMFIFSLLPWPGKHGAPPLPFPQRVVVGSALFVVFGGLSWAFSYTKENVRLTKTKVTVGSGRSALQLKLDAAVEIRRQESEGQRFLLFTNRGREELRVYLAAESESEVMEFMRNAGLSVEEKRN